MKAKGRGNRKPKGGHVALNLSFPGGKSWDECAFGDAHQSALMSQDSIVTKARVIRSQLQMRPKKSRGQTLSVSYLGCCLHQIV